MKPETERLLHQCRAALLQYSNEQLNTLFVSWFERMVGEEFMDEDLDDLCLLLGYGIRSAHTHLLYSTYTAWWEVEGDPDGEFICSNVAALQQYLITMPVKQFGLIAELAFQVCTQEAETDSQPRPPIGQEWLRALAAWLNTGAQEPFYRQIWLNQPPTPPPSPPPQQLSRKQRKAQQRKAEQALVDQAWQHGYLLLGPTANDQVLTLIRSRCKKNHRPYISVQEMGSQFANICIELRTVFKAFEAEGKLFRTLEPTFTLTDDLRQRLTLFAQRYSVRSETAPQEAFTLSPHGDVLELKQVPHGDVPSAVQDFMALWPAILRQYELQIEASRVAYQARQRELEEERKPAWLKAIARLSAQGPEVTCPSLAATIVLPEDWDTLLSKDQLGAFLTFLKLPASSRELKSNLVQHLLTRLEVDNIARALFFEVFAFELAVPPWELETLLDCTTTERKRWTEEEKLPVLGYGNFRKAGGYHDYPVYDRRVILTLTSSDIERWRNEHQALVRERRRAAAQAAASSRKAKRLEAQMAHQG